MNNNEHPRFEEIQLLTGSDVAAILNISKAYAYRIMRSGDVPVVKLGRAVRVRFEDLEAFITAMLIQKKAWQ
jgi:excisionase family DNA binding protein